MNFHRKTSSRRGIFLIEIAAALLVLMIAIGLLGMTVAKTVTASREMARRSWAMREACNAMERLSALPGAALDATTATAALSPCEGRVRRHLPDGSLTVTLSEPDDAGLTRIALMVSWTGAGDQPVRPVRLVGWRVAAKAKEATR
jgi:Tfp pilus assembly protein PilV